MIPETETELNTLMGNHARTTRLETLDQAIKRLKYRRDNWNVYCGEYYGFDESIITLEDMK